MLININDLLGKPYKIHARGPASYDCYGLVMEVERRLGRDMKDLYKYFKENKSVKSLRDIQKSSEQQCVVKTNKGSFGDIVVFFLPNGRIYHVGVLLKNDDFIHCNKDGVNIMKIKDYPLRSEVYKWK